MAAKVFLDANILLDYTLKREHYLEAHELLQLIVDNKLQGFITSSVLHITGHWLTKAYGAETAKEVLLSLLAELRVIDISHETALLALHSKINDIEDALQYYAAIHHKIDYFISRDKQLQKDNIPVLPVYPPDVFLGLIN